MNISSYEKAADSAGYIYLQKYVITDRNQICSFPHSHDSVELIVVAKGSYIAHVNAAERVLKAGEICFVNSFDTHFYKWNGDAVVYAVVVNTSYISAIKALKDHSLPNFMDVCSDFSDIELLLEKIFAVIKGADELIKTGFVNLLFGILLRNYPLTTAEREKNAQTLVKTLQYINVNYSKNISLCFLAEKFGYSKNYFSRIFNEYTGMNLREYLNRRRIVEAETLFARAESLPACKIAELCGFESMNTFYRAYKKYRGTPYN